MRVCIKEYVYGEARTRIKEVGGGGSVQWEVRAWCCAGVLSVCGGDMCGQSGSVH